MSDENKKTKKKKKWWIIIVVILGICVIGSMGDSSEKDTTVQTQETEDKKTVVNVVEEPVKEVISEVESVVEEVVEDDVPEMTMGQKNALKSAKNYISVMAFSYSGLIHQLEYEGYSTEDATFAADNCGADWNEQAAKSAKNYLDVMAFSKDGLIEQLEYEGYTKEQAEYGVSAVGY